MIRHHSFHPPLHVDRSAEFLAGAAFGAFGIAFACGAGTLASPADGRWESAYLPMLAGVLVALAGNFMVLRSLARRRFETGDRRGALHAGLVLAALSLTFATTLGGLSAYGLPTVGLLGGIYIAGFTSRVALRKVGAGLLLGLAAALTLGSYLAFVVALDFRLPIWPSFLHA